MGEATREHDNHSVDMGRPPVPFLIRVIKRHAVVWSATQSGAARSGDHWVLHYSLLIARVEDAAGDARSFSNNQVSG